MKILYVGYYNPHFITVTEYVERALRGLGHEVETVNYRDWLIPGRIRSRVPALDLWDTRRINRDLVRKAEVFRPEVLIVFGATNIYPETIAEIKRRFDPVTVSMVADFPMGFDFHLMAGPYYDHFFPSGTDGLLQYQKAGHTNGYWLPFGCDPEIHRPIELTCEERKKYGSDICFVGSYYTEREVILEPLAGFDLGLWGIGWEKLPKGSPLRRHVRGGSLRPDEWVKVFNAAKIVINIVARRADVREPFAFSLKDDDFRMCNTRVFEILGCGAFQMVNRKDDVLELFKDKEHIALFDEKRPDEVPASVEYYLTHADERRRIAAAGRREAVEKHTYRSRMEYLFTVINKGRGLNGRCSG
ncbi:MAG: glycosyltransferase [Candidatus Omnitrophica bacterium]|nr:glycosyltransferase [Candidatus Omnitrophota bacterium]